MARQVIIKCSNKSCLHNSDGYCSMLNEVELHAPVINHGNSAALECWDYDPISEG